MRTHACVWLPCVLRGLTRGFALGEAEKLASHIESVGVEWMHLTFRWMNCLLLRELPHRLVLRLWDALLCEDDGFESFHVFVCATLLVGFSAELLSLPSMQVCGVQVPSPSPPRAVRVGVLWRLLVAWVSVWHSLTVRALCPVPYVALAGVAGVPTVAARDAGQVDGGGRGVTASASLRQQVAVRLGTQAPAVGTVQPGSQCF